MGSVGSLESLRMHWFPYFFYSGDLGSVGSPEMHSFPCIFHDLFSGVESVGNPESSRIIDLHNFFMISSVEWEAWESQNHSKCMDFHTFFYDFFGGVGSVGNPESLKMHWMHAFVHNLFGGVGSVGSRESLQMMDYHTFFMISSVEWEAWEDQNHLKYVDFMRFQDFVRWSGKRGKPRITKNICFCCISKTNRWSGKREKPRIPENSKISSHDFFCEVGNVWSSESLKMHDFIAFFIIFSMEWEAWKTQNQWWCIDSIHFSWFLRWSGRRGQPRIMKKGWISIHVPWFLRWSRKRGKPRITGNAMISMHFHDFFGGVGSVGSIELLKMYGSPCIYHDFFGGVVSVGSLES